VTTPTTAARPTHDLAIGYLRAFVTLLVLAHHAVLAYHPFAPPPPTSLSAWPPLWRVFPVVDSDRWGGFAWIVGFNDSFFMALMFFLSGLYAWGSLRRKGPTRFARDRTVRLGLPFLAGAVIVAPVAYFASYLQTGAAPSLADFARDWSSGGTWATGPVWFLWVLLAFDMAAAAAYAAAPGWAHGPRWAAILRRPAAAFALVVAASALAYVPLTFVVDPGTWTGVGPFAFQTTRFVHYAVYFFAGVVVGANRVDADLLRPDGKLARRFPLWVALMAAAFAACALAVLRAFATGSRTWATIASCGFVVSCAASSFGFLSLFLRFARTARRAADAVRENAYGMYVVHYAFAAWLQYALLGVRLPGLAKGTLAFAGTVALSYAAVAALRRLRAVARVIGPAVA
jgi:hypothetical protein